MNHDDVSIARLTITLVILTTYVVVPTTSAQIRLTDMSAQVDMPFLHQDGSSGQNYIVEYVSAGLALFDFDRDGDIDIYYLNGAPRDAKTGAATTNALFRNEGNWRFTDITKEARVGDTRHGLGVTVGDFDNDGWPDLYLNNDGPNVLYRNLGDGTFRDVAHEAGVINGDRVGAGTCFLDMDADGDLDLYVANYLIFDQDKHVLRTINGFPVYASPRDYPADHDTLFRNNGDGTFTDVSDESGIAAHVGYGMGTVCLDYDQDGDTDIFVGNDVGKNFLFQNDGRGHFKEIGTLSGFAYDGTGGIQGSMGVAAGDIDNDGYLDLHATSYQNELATLYRNLRGAFFEDITKRSGAGLGTFTVVTWGNGIVDLDNDGHRDLLMVCGHLNDLIEKYDSRGTYRTPNAVFANRGNGKFQNVTDSVGNGMSVQLSSRGAGFDDLDNDGDVDVVILNSRHGPTLLRNDSPDDHNWLQLELRGQNTNRDGVGARVEVIAGKSRWVDEVHSGQGYQGHFGSRLYFGLGKTSQVDQIRVNWLGGGTDVHERAPINQRLILTEGEAWQVPR